MKKISTLLSLALVLTFTAGAQNANYKWFLGGGGAQGSDYAADITTDAAGNIFTACNFLNSASFNGVQHTGSPTGKSFEKSMFISKIGPSKTTLWSLFSNAGNVDPKAIATTPKGELIVTGTIKAVAGGATNTANLIDAAGTVTTFDNLGSATNDLQSFVAKFNANGILQWIKELDSSTSKDTTVATSGVDVDANGNVYVAGNFTKTLVLPAATNIELTSANKSQASFIAKLDGNTGAALWCKTSSGSIDYEAIPALVYGKDGFIYAAANFKNATVPVDMTFGGKSFKLGGINDLIFIKIDTLGNVGYVQDHVNGSDIRPSDIAVKDSKVFVCGSAKGNTVFSSDTLKQNAKYLNGFIAAFSSNDGSDLWQKAVYSAALSAVGGITVGKDNNLYAFGYHYNGMGTTVTPAPVDFGDGFTLTDATNKLGDLFLSSYDITNGTTKEVHLAGKSTGGESAGYIASQDSNLYLLGITNSTLTFENNTDSYKTSGSYDFILINYAVDSQATGLIDKTAVNSTFAYYDKSSESIVISNSDKVVSAKLFDASGRLIRSVNKTENMANMSAQGIRSGLYIIRLTDNSGKSTINKLLVY